MMLGIPDSRSKITLSQTIEESRIGDIWSILNQSLLQCSHKNAQKAQELKNKLTFCVSCAFSWPK
jgi:hypothetical protein